MYSTSYFTTSNSCADIREIYQYIYLILTHCNQQCDQRHWYTCIPCYWHMPLNEYASHIAHICPTALVPHSAHRLNITAHIHKIVINCNIYLLYYCKIYAVNKYAPQLSYTCHMAKLHNVHQQRKYANSYATCEHTGINNVTWGAVHRWWHKMMMMPQPDYIYWVGHLVKSVKNNT